MGCNPCRERVMTVITGKESFMKVKWLFNLITLIFYIFDIVTGAYASVRFYKDGDPVWGAATLSFMILPVIISCIVSIIFIIGGRENFGIYECCIVLGLVSFSPILPVLILTNGFIDEYRGKDSGYAGLYKLCHALFQSLPQSCWQMYIIMQVLKDETRVIGTFQYLTLTASLLTLLFTIATSSIFEEAAMISRLAFFFFGLLGFTSRLLVYCLFSYFRKGFWFLPISIEIGAAIAIWLVKRFCILSNVVPLSKANHSSCEIETIIRVPLFWLMTTLFNSFTGSSMVISGVNIALAIGSYFLVPCPIISIVTITLSVISLVANFLLIVIPPMRVIGNDWLIIDENNESFLY